MNELINELINNEAVYRTVPSTPGLLNNRLYTQTVMLLAIGYKLCTAGAA